MENDIWIKRVEIYDFQSHQETKLDLIKGTNAFVGTSNSGKSAIIRAIKWCLLNKPGGSEFIRVGAKESTVRVFLSNGKTIERRKAKTKTNLYALYQDEELVDEYTGFGSKVPPEITEAHGIVPISGDIFFQFADQLEAPFMLSLKPRQRAEILGNMEELMKIDNALNDINDDVRLHSTEKKQLEKNEKELQLEKDKKQQEVKRLGEKVDSLKELKEQIIHKRKMHEFLSEKLKRLQENQHKLKELQGQNEKAARIIEAFPTDLEERINAFKTLDKHLKRLEEIKEELQSISYLSEETLCDLGNCRDIIEEKVTSFRKLGNALSTIYSNKETIEKIHHNFSAKVADMDITDLEENIKKYKTLNGKLQQLRRNEEEAKESKQVIEETREKIDKLMTEFVDGLKHAQLCPTCGRETEGVCEEHIQNIV